MATDASEFVTKDKIKEIVGEFSNQQFADHLASELAPILSLFGENVAKQFLGSMTGFSDIIIFAMAPIGVITAVISAIRVGGPTWLKAIIGRARENRSQAEVELMSSTSHDVCELWNGQQIVRIMGRPEIVELIMLPRKETRTLDGPALAPKASDQGSIQTDVHTTSSGGTEVTTMETRCKLYTLKAAIQEDLLEPSRPRRFLFGSRTPKSQQQGGAYRDLNAEQERHELDASPNISLNLYDHISRWELYAAAVVGIILQGAVIAYIGSVAYYPKLHEKLVKDEEKMPSYGAPLAKAGTVVLIFGLIFCAYVIETSTVEERYSLNRELKAKSGDSLFEHKYKPRIMWLQRSGRVGDMGFDSFAIFARGGHRTVMTSRRRMNKLEDKHGHFPTGLELMTVFGAIITIAGFVAQFTGVRSLHYSVAVVQLGAMIGMMVLRAFIRRRLAVRPFVQKLPVGHELDWLATRFPDPNNKEYGINQQLDLWRDGEAKIQESNEDDVVEERSDGIIKNKDFWSEECHHTLDFDKILAVRSREIDYSILEIFKARKSLSSMVGWDYPIKNTARIVANSIEVILNSEIFKWNQNVLNTYDHLQWEFPGIAKWMFTARRSNKKWRVEVEDIEAVLSLWVYSSTSKLQRSKKRAATIKGHPTADDRNVYILGHNTETLQRDLQWWCPDGSRLHEMNPTGRWDALKIHESRVIELANKFKSGVNQATNIVLFESRLVALEETASKKPEWTEANQPQGVIRSRTRAQGNLAVPLAPRHAPSVHRRSQRNSYNPPDPSRKPHQFLASMPDVPLDTFYAQAMFAAFVRHLAMEGYIGVPGEARVEFKNGSNTWNSIHLEHDRLSDIIAKVELTSLGTAEEIWHCILPALSEFSLLPSAMGICTMDADRAWEYLGQQKWTEVVKTLESLSNISTAYPSKHTVSRKATAIILEILRVMKKSSTRKTVLVPKPVKQDIRMAYILGLDILGKLNDEHKLMVRSMCALLTKQGRGDGVKDVLKAVDGSSALVDQDDVCHISAQMPEWYQKVVAGRPIIEEDLEKYIQQLGITDDFDWTALHYACLDEGEHAVANLRLLLKKSTDIESMLGAGDIAGYTPLHYALATRNGQEKLRLLLKYNAELTLQTRDGLEPLHVAAQFRKYEVMKTIFVQKQKVNVNAMDIFGRTPLHYAAADTSFDTINILRLLCTHFADRTTQDDFSRTPFHVAVLSGQLSNCRFLVEQGVEINERDSEGATALHLALEMEACSDELVRVLIELGMDLCARDRHQQTTLHYAARSDNSTKMKTLLEAFHHLPLDARNTKFKNPIEVKDTAKERPLHEAVRGKHFHVVKELIERGANPLAPDANGITPIEDAPSVDMLELMLTNVTSESGPVVIREEMLKAMSDQLLGTLLELDVRVARFESLKGLWPRGKETLLHYAARNGLKLLAERILYGRDPADSFIDRHDDFELTPLYLAMASDNNRVASLLIDQGASKETALLCRDSRGDTLLHQISERPFDYHFYTPVVSGVNPSILETPNPKGLTPLLATLASTSTNSIQALRFLVNIRTNVSAVCTAKGSFYLYNALHIIVACDPHQATKKIKYLFDKGVLRTNHFGQVTPHGETAYNLANKLEQPGDTNISGSTRQLYTTIKAQLKEYRERLVKKEYEGLSVGTPTRSQSAYTPTSQMSRISPGVPVNGGVYLTSNCLVGEDEA